MDQQQLEEIKKRNAARTPGRWRWTRLYEFSHESHIWTEGHHCRHWALENADDPTNGHGDGMGRVINHRLVLETSDKTYTVDESITGPDGLTDAEKAEGKTWAHRSLDQDPDFIFVAKASEDVPALLAEVEWLQAIIQEYRLGLRSSGII